MTTVRWRPFSDLYLYHVPRQPVYGFLRSDTHPLGKAPWLVIGALLIWRSSPSFTARLPRGESLCLCRAVLHPDGHADSVINANYGALFPELFRTDSSRASTNHAPGIPTGGHDHQHCPHAHGDQRHRPRRGHRLRHLGGVILYMSLTSREVRLRSTRTSPGCGTA